MVRRHDDHDRIGVVAADFEGRQANAGGRVALAGLAQNSAGRQLGQLLAQCIDQAGVGDDQHALGRDHAGQAIDGRLDHGPLAHEAEQLLGTQRSALRPEPCSGPAGHDYSM